MSAESLNPVIAIDVGGSNVDCAIVDTSLKIIGEVKSIKSPSNLSKHQILRLFSDIINACVSQAKSCGFDIDTCVVAMPNPFDYKNGISHMTHKFKSLNGVNLKLEIEKTTKVKVSFLNDADAFGYGVITKILDKIPDRLVTITLGTGVGSCLFINKELKDLEIWDFPYKAGILEDYISSKSLSDAYFRASHKRLSVKEIAELAKVNDQTASDILEEFGTELGQGLAKSLKQIKPQLIVIGGRISNAFDLFSANAISSYLYTSGSSVKLLNAPDPNLPLYGSSYFAFSQTV